MLVYLWTLSLSGFLLYFCRRFLTQPEAVADLHWILGLAFFPALLMYLLQHYKRTQKYREQIHFQFGVGLALGIFVTTLTGIPLIWPNLKQPFIILAHVMAGFALCIFLGSHLALVQRIYLARQHLETATLSRIIRQTSWYIPAFASVAILVAFLALY